MSSSRPIIVGTRASALAKRQTELALALLRQAHPGLSFQVKEVSTKGDTSQERPIAELGIGIFVKELEATLLDGRIDVAVHSFKDLPTEWTTGLVVAAIPPREDARDVLVSRHRTGLTGLPKGARVGTGSPRRKAQLLAHRPDLTVVPVRGNVDTRVRKAVQGDSTAKPEQALDAVVLAAAGLHRLDIAQHVAEYLPFDVCLPAVGQGALALQVREDDARVRETVAALDDPAARAAVLSERAFLAAFGGGCRVPIAAYGQVTGDALWLRGMVASDDGVRLVRSEAHGSAARAEAIGRELALRLLALGAGPVLAAGTTP